MLSFSVFFIYFSEIIFSFLNLFIFIKNLKIFLSSSSEKFSSKKISNWARSFKRCLYTSEYILFPDFEREINISFCLNQIEEY